MRKRCSYDIREGHLCTFSQAPFTPSTGPSNRTTAIPTPTYTYVQSALPFSRLPLHFTLSTRGARALLANPNRRSFVGGSQLFRAFLYALCMLETPERLATRHHGPPSRCPLEHTKTTKKCRAPSSGEPGSRCLDGTLRSFAQINARFLHIRHCWLGGNSVVGSVRAGTLTAHCDASRTALMILARGSCH